MVSAMKRSAILLAILVSLLWPRTAPAQEGAEDRLKALEEQIEKQQEELDALRKKVEELDAAPVLRQPFSFQVFSDITAVVDNRDRSENTFVLGEVDLYAQADLGDGLSALVETVFEADDENNEWDVDLERIQASYASSDLLSLTVGKFHIPIGFWNDEFHHGGYLQPSVSRPTMLRFEDQEGILPVHGVGLALSGKLPTPGKLHYDLFVVNGRGRWTDDVLNTDDNNGAKGVGGKVEFRGLPCSRVGVSLYRDTVDAEPADGADVEFYETIYACHIVCERKGFRAILEGFLMDHDGRDLDRGQETRGGYILVSYEIDAITPYVMVERVDFPGDDPYFAGRSDVGEGRVGVRWDFHPNAAVKLEYNHTELRDDETTGTDDRYGTVLMNISFFF
ncbi:MAG: hypothetical protein A2Z34_06005 [Planctomycetes bacterium RBG_16_59_8]|nr:MAG: hypothetical protein A2Z34_06005 [Planctomycetes bacterium RBG_16_59_8]